MHHFQTVDSMVVLHALLDLIREFFIFMLPIIGLLAGVYIIWRMLISVLFHKRLVLNGGDIYSIATSLTDCCKARAIPRLSDHLAAWIKTNYNILMENERTTSSYNKNIQPLHNDIEIEKNRSFASPEVQKRAVEVQNANTPQSYRNKLAEETRDILKQKQNHEIKLAIRHMRKNVLKLAFVFAFFFIVAIYQKNETAFLWPFFIILQIPYYAIRRSWIIKDHKDTQDF